MHHHRFKTWQVFVGLAIVLGLGVLGGLIAGWWSRSQLELKDDSVRSGGHKEVEKGIRVAQDTWGNVCNGQVGVTFFPLDGKIAGQANSYVDQVGNHSQCTVAITDKRPFSARVRCAIIVHEYGHLVGRDHVNDPRNIMNPTITKKNIPTACY